MYTDHRAILEDIKDEELKSKDTKAKVQITIGTVLVVCLAAMIIWLATIDFKIPLITVACIVAVFVFIGNWREYLISVLSWGLIAIGAGIIGMMLGLFN